MNKDNVILKLKQVVIDCLELDRTPDDFPGVNLISEIGITSIHAMQILLAVEEAFDIEIGYGDLNLELVKSLSTLADYILNEQNK